MTGGAGLIETAGGSLKVEGAVAERVPNRAEGANSPSIAMFAADPAVKSPFTRALGKQALLVQLDPALGEAYSRALAHAGTNAAHPDAKDGMSAFVESRPPNWSP